MSDHRRGLQREASNPPVFAALLWLALALTAGGTATAAPQALWPSPGERVWTGPDGSVLPFRDDEEVLDFLRTATVVSTQAIPVGVTRPLKVLLERDGLRMHSVFRHVDLFKRHWRSREGMKTNFRDSCRFEVAAYELGRLLGIDNIPPVVEREVEGRKGTLQAWVEGTMTEAGRKEQGLEPPEPSRWMFQYQVMWLFDNLIYNDDRNKGNILIDRDWNLWMIDATRAFRPVDALRNPRIVRYCERRIWERLRSVSDEEIRERLDPYLGSFEMSCLLKRRQRLVRHLEELIRLRGENVVLFDRHQLAAAPDSDVPVADEPLPEP